MAVTPEGWLRASMVRPSKAKARRAVPARSDLVRTRSRLALERVRRQRSELPLRLAVAAQRREGKGLQARLRYVAAAVGADAVGAVVQALDGFVDTLERGRPHLRERELHASRQLLDRVVVDVFGRRGFRRHGVAEAVQ